MILGCVWHWSLELAAFHNSKRKCEEAYLVRVSEPRRALLLAVDQRDPVIAAATVTLPHIWVTVHAPQFLGLLEWLTRRGTDAMGKALIVPERGILQDQPAPRFANPTPALALVSMTAYPFRGVKITVKTQFLLMGYHVRVGRVHILWRRWYLFFVQRCEQLRRV